MIGIIKLSMFKKALLTSLFLFLPLAAQGAADLAISPADIKFSPAKPLSGDAVRIYASVRNTGQQDARLSVRFFIDGKSLGSDQPTSVVVGQTSTVFMDWTPNEGYFKVAVELVDINPGDGQAENNRAEIKDFLVNLDSDHDGKHDTEDLDDDNDGIDDGVEIINGTNPLKWDTDGDGVGDKDDAYPNDLSKSKKEVIVVPEPKREPPVAEKITEVAATAPAAKPIVKEKTIAPAEAEAAIIKIEETIKTLADPSERLDLVIAKSRLGWRGWEFEALGAPTTANYLWDFGDKQLGEGRQIKHDFLGSGTYKVTLSASDGAGTVGQTEETIVIGFWHLANIYVQVILGVLALGIIALIIALIFDLLPKYED